MFFLQQLKLQFESSFILYFEAPVGEGREEMQAAAESVGKGPEQVDPTESYQQAVDVNRKLGNAVNEEDARGLIEKNPHEAHGFGKKDVVDRNDTLKDGGEVASEAVNEVDDSVDNKDITPSLDDVRATAKRNGVSQMGDESGEKTEEDNMTDQERQTAISNIKADRDRMAARMNEYKPGTPERAAVEKEMNALQMLANVLIHGSVNPPQVDSQGRAIPHSPGRNSFEGGIGEPLTGEMLEEYGQTGHELASWLRNRGFPVYEGKPFYCGKNVGECLNEFGIQGLPQHGRNGADWAQICRERPNQFKQIQCTPQEAPAGALISYERGTGGSEARQKYGHIEIVLGNNSGYYFGTVASSPGGSNKSFAPGTYSVWMPISKTA